MLSHSMTSAKNAFAVALCALLGVMTLCNWNTACQESQKFKTFNQFSTPAELDRLLGNSAEIQKSLVSEKLAQKVMEKLKDLSPETRRELQQLAESFKNNGASRSTQRRLQRLLENDPKLKEAMVQAKEELQDEDISIDELDPSKMSNSLKERVQERISKEISRSIRKGEFPLEIDPDERSDSSSNRYPGLNRSDSPEFSPSPSRSRSRDRSNSSSSQIQPPSNNSRNDSDANQSGSSDSGGSSSGTGTSGNGSGSSGSGDNSGANPPPTRNNKLPKEKPGHRFNRAIMKSLEKAMERKVGEVEGDSSFDSLVDKLAITIAKNPEFARMGSNRKAGNKLQNVFKNIFAKSRDTFSRIDGAPSSAGTSSSALSSISATSLLIFIILAGALVGVIAFLFKQSSFGQMFLSDSDHREQHSIAPPAPLQAYAQSNEIIQSIDRLTLWLFGHQASWWNSGMVKSHLVERRPDLSNEIGSVIEVYELARYAPDGVVDVQGKASVINSTLRELSSSQGPDVEIEYRLASGVQNS